MYILLLSMSADLTKQLGMAPGGEFRRAFAEVSRYTRYLLNSGAETFKGKINFFPCVRRMFCHLFVKYLFLFPTIFMCCLLNTLFSLIRDILKPCFFNVLLLKVNLFQARRVPMCLIHLGDRPIHITLQRAFASLSWWQTIRLMWYLLTSKEPIR